MTKPSKRSASKVAEIAQSEPPRKANSINDSFAHVVDCVRLRNLRFFADFEPKLDVFRHFYLESSPFLQAFLATGLSSMLPRPLRMYPFNAVAFTGCGRTASIALCNRARLQSCADKAKRINRFVTGHDFKACSERSRRMPIKPKESMGFSPCGIPCGSPTRPSTPRSTPCHGGIYAPACSP